MEKHKREKTTVIIKSMAPKDEMVAELWCGEERLGEVIKDGNSFNVKIFPPPHGTWRLDLEDFISLLNGAREQLGT